MSLTRFAVRYRPVTYLVCFVLLALGIFAIFALSRREDPELSARFLQVIALYPGATAAQVEELVTEKLERTLREIDDTKNVDSVSRPGISVLTIEAADHAGDLKHFTEEIRNRTDDQRPNLPRGVTNVIVNDRFADVSAMILSVSKAGGTDRQREDITKALRDRLRRLPDVAEAKLIGDQQEVVTLNLSPERLARLGVSPAMVATAVGNSNILSQSGGSVNPNGRDTRLTIQPTGELNTLSTLENLIVTNTNSTPVYLRDVARVTRGYADPSSFRVRVDGKPAVALSLTMRKGHNISLLGAAVQAEITRFQREQPADVTIQVVNDLPRSVARRMNEFRDNLIAGVLLIFVVMYLFMGLRSALIVGTLLPITIVGTFAAMFIVGRDIQQMSIAALIIALGLVVDNSIVVIDNIEKKLGEGIEAEEAAIRGTEELSIPLLTSNLTTVASFAPLIFLSGGVGEFIRDLGIVTSLSTVVSLFFNYTLTPLIALRFLRAGSSERQNIAQRGLRAGINQLRTGFSWLAERGLRRPAITVALAIGLMLFAFSNIGRLGSQFFPLAERDQFTVDVWLPEGRDIAATERVAARVEKILDTQKGVRSYISYVGQGGPRFYYNISPEASAANYAQIVVNTASIEETKRIVQAVQKAADNSIADARITARILEQGPPVGAPIAVRVSGQNIQTLRQIGDQVKTILNRTSGTSSVYDSFGAPPLGLKVVVDNDRAALLGLNSAAVADATRMAFSGQTVSLLREGDKEIPIDMRLDPHERTSTDGLLDLYLPGANGVSVPLRQVAQVRLTGQEGRIVRRNAIRTLTVSAFSDGSRLPSVTLAEARKEIDALKVPVGYAIGYGGEQEETGRSFSELLLILMLSLAANLLIVVWEFNDFRVALTVLSAVPFGVTGAIAGLFLAHQPFGFMAFLGIISLGGVVTNHAIVLFEYARHERENGMNLSEALVEAGRRRLRPILLTVVLSIGGLIPQAVNGGNLWPPLAWSLIAGLLCSMILTLVVVPSVFKVLSGGGRRMRQEQREVVPVQTVTVR